jgi:hypothetical protein
VEMQRQTLVAAGVVEQAAQNLLAAMVVRA